MNRLCSVLEVSRLSCYDYCKRKARIDAERIRLRTKATGIFNKSRQSGGCCTIVIKMRQEGAVIGRFKARRLMKEANLVSRQPKPSAYKTAKVERPACWWAGCPLCRKRERYRRNLRYSGGSAYGVECTRRVGQAVRVLPVSRACKEDCVNGLSVRVSAYDLQT